MKTTMPPALSMALLLTLTVSACALPLASASDPVTFLVPIPKQVFSSGAVLHVTVWNARQMRLSDNNAPCAVSHDALTGVDQVQCPPGVQYQAAAHEEFTFLASSLGASLAIPSRSVHVGEAFQISISGLSQDGCNSASASVKGTARSARVTLQDLMWMTTEMGCP